jgi:cytochrome b
LLALAFTLAFILGGEEQFLSLHAALGIFIGLLVVFRIIQGFIGPRYARFSDFPVSPSSIKMFITNMKQSKSMHPGHNPLASIIMLSIFVMAFLSAISGMLIFASGDTGIFGFRLNPGSDAEIFEEFHDVVVHLFLILVGVHLTGILFDTLFHPGNGTILSIFTGYKRIKAVPALPTLSQKLFSIFWLVIPLFTFFYILLYQPMPAEKKDNLEQVSDNDNDED